MSVFRGDHRVLGAVGLFALLRYEQEQRMAVPTAHAGHHRIECSRCGSVVAQCRCIGPKPVSYQEGCDECPPSAAVPPLEPTLRLLIDAYGAGAVADALTYLRSTETPR
jgi:hypothetical protein